MPIVILVTAADEDEASLIGHKLVDKRLAACVNILLPVRSIYRWQGQIQDEPEVMLVVKSRASLFEDVLQTVRENHSYQVPEIIALPIVAGYPPYLAWLRSETSGSSATGCNDP